MEQLIQGRGHRVAGSHLKVAGSAGDALLEAAGQVAQAAALLHPQPEAKLPCTS